LKGWLFDVYPGDGDQITVCVKTVDGDIKFFNDDYSPAIYVYGGRKDLKTLKAILEEDENAKKLSFERRRVKLGDSNRSKVLKVVCKMDKIFHIVQKIEKSGDYHNYELYNVDIPQAQDYLHENDLFPLEKIKISALPKIKFEPLESAKSVRYDLPPLKIANLSVKAKRLSGEKRFRGPIEKINLSVDGKDISIEGANETERIIKLVKAIRKSDPDIILTEGGDSWDLPYLAKRAKLNEISNRLILGREPRPLRERRSEGTSYFSYGRIYYKPPPHYLKGRIHVDVQNSFIYQKCGLQGLIELSRMTRTPLQKTARSSIGSAMTNLQLYWVQRNGILIPWKKSETENFKSSLKLLEADRGGFIYEPGTGFHKDVGEIDFASFYPTLMKKHNLSPETVLCDCCPESKEKVPDLGYNICEERRGFIPQVLDPVLEKRRKYKKLAAETRTEEGEDTYKKRQKALKWILVTCFGYLGYRNAKFGKIEAHESVTSFARKNLRKGAKIAEEEGFEIIHGIVDSLWVKKPKLNISELNSLCRKIKKETKLPISPEGKYRWIVFPPSKENIRIPVVNRYYGVFETGELRMRGIAARRSDTPKVLAEAQKGVIGKLSEANDRGEFEEKIREALKLVESYANRIRKKTIRAEKLAIGRKLSRDPGSYKKNVKSAIAAEQLEEAGFELHAGQRIRYVVTNADAKNSHHRVRPVQLLKRKKKYDSRWYVEKLLETVEEILLPFNYTKDKIKSEILEKGKQEKLKP